MKKDESLVVTHCCGHVDAVHLQAHESLRAHKVAAGGLHLKLEGRHVAQGCRERAPCMLPRMGLRKGAEETAQSASDGGRTR